MKCIGCGKEKPIHAKGFCNVCYRRLQRHGSTEHRERPKKGEHLCSQCHRDPVHAKGLCKVCYNRKRLLALKHGECKNCGKLEKIVARGLCPKCYAKDIEQRKSAICVGCKEFKPIKADGMCRKCRARYLRHGDPTKGDRPVKGAKLCSVCNKRPVHAKDMCGECYAKHLREKNAEQYLEYDLQRYFGISLVEYNEMLENQDGVCAICGKEEATKVNGKRVRLSVDHDHKTGKIRGLLCGNCNRGIGNLQDSPGLLKKAIDYLK